ncbi:MAG: hypothetical protein AAGC71_03965 [Pseudomonadota bacterium]
MAKGGIDYIYLETHNKAEAVTFWQSLGFGVVMDIGHAAKLAHADGGTVFVEQVPADKVLETRLYLHGDRTATTTVDPANIVSDWQPSHWDTHLRVLSDTDGRQVVVQDPN